MITDFDVFTVKEDYRIVINECKSMLVSMRYQMYDLGSIDEIIDIMVEIINSANIECNLAVCIVAAYAHQVSIIDGVLKDDANAVWLPEASMQKKGCSSEFVKQVRGCVEQAGILGSPKTPEGNLLRDADKLAWLGTRRWKKYFSAKMYPESILSRLEYLRDNILYFTHSKEIYDRMIINVLTSACNEIKRLNALESKFSKDELIL